MSERQIGSSLVYKTRQEQEKRLKKKGEERKKTQNESNQVTFFLNYQENDGQNIRNRSELLQNYSQIQKLRVRQKPFPFPKMMQIKKDFKLQMKAPNNVSLNFDLFNPKRKQREQSNDTTLLERFQETVMLSKQKYLQKVKKQNRKKSERCSLLKSYGLNIKTAQRFNIQERSPQRMAQTLVQMPPPSSSFSRDNNIKTACQIKPKRELSQTKTFDKQSDQIRSFLLNALEQSDKTKLKTKYEKMIQSQTVILQSFGYYLDPSSIDKETKFKFFVGKGNNRNLICYLMKKRWWWTETADATGANFVWTQLKHKSTLKKIDSFHTQCENEHHCLLFKQDTAFPLKKIKTNNIFFHEKMRDDFRHILSESEKKVLLKPFKMPVCVHNHFGRSEVLDNKNSLFFNLETYCTFKQRDPFQILPLTFVIDNCVPQDFQQFYLKTSQMKKSVWIVKPAENTNRGNGIFVSSNLQQIRTKITTKSRQQFIIQKYITNLFLYQKRKFDIRVYLLTFSLGGVTKFFWYQEGYIRTSSEIYDLKDLSDQYIHLTNDAVQNRNENYGKYQQGNKLSYHQFQLYLDHNYPQNHFSVQKLNKEMKDITAQTIQSTYPRHIINNKQYGFELFGLDFLVDNSFKPWLIEVNTNPCLELSSPVQQRIIPTMLQNMFRIVLDPVFSPIDDTLKYKHHIYESCFQKNKFELIFDSLFDRDLQWEQYSATKEHSKKVK